MTRIKFFTALSAVVIYEILILLIQPVGLSLTKLFITLLIWISFFSSFYIFQKNYYLIKNRLPYLAFLILAFLIFWNIINIIRGAFNDDSITTILGNNETTLALLVPFSLAFGIDKANLRIINWYFIGLIIISTPLYLIFHIFSGESDNEIYNRSFQILLSGTPFLIPIIPFQTNINKFIIFLGSLVLFYLAIKTNVRTMNIRIIMLYFSLIAILLYMKFNLKWIIIIAFLSLLLPFLLLHESISNEQSAFESFNANGNDNELTDDTRTFLYVEVFEDLRENKSLIFGKGSNGRYYSPYFADHEGDASTRLSMEVGILALLLKGGFIAVFLNLAILLITIYLAFFQTNNYLVIGVGFMLLVHTLLLFIQNYVDYSIYNLTVWFFIGVCLSKEIRSLNNTEIKNILVYGKIVS